MISAGSKVGRPGDAIVRVQPAQQASQHISTCGVRNERRLPVREYWANARDAAMLKRGMLLLGRIGSVSERSEEHERTQEKRVRGSQLTRKKHSITQQECTQF